MASPWPKMHRAKSHAAVHYQCDRCRIEGVSRVASACALLGGKMLKLGKLTDYAIVLLTYCAKTPPGDSTTARHLSEISHLPLPTVSKIMKALARAGILASHRGVKGGYRLARDAGDVSIATVIEAIEGPVRMTECCGVQTPRLCELETTCPVHRNWSKINDVVLAALDQLTIADMAEAESLRTKTGRLLELVGRRASVVA
ncbi:MAG: SUF system Fe-S cluster assembly regulator [Deltaproteobacteria bacterium]|nr:SUF system Fe-S cluster assembly regulator [Deltaproteobacteria bacterium]